MPYLLLLIPAALAILRLTTRKYPFSALTTLACAALIAVYGRAPAIGLAAAALAVSAAGDWFLAHHRGRWWRTLPTGGSWPRPRWTIPMP